MIALDLYVGENSLLAPVVAEGVGVPEVCADEPPPGPRCQRPGESGPDGAPVIDVFSPVRSDWNDTTSLAVTEGRWP